MKIVKTISIIIIILTHSSVLDNQILIVTVNNFKNFIDEGEY